MANPFSAVKRGAAWLFRVLNHHGESASADDAVSRHLSGKMAELNSEAKARAGGGGGGRF